MGNDTISFVVETIRELARRGTLPADLADVQMSGTTTVDTLGLDSIARLELLAELEERADIAVPESLVVGIRTIGDLAAALVHLGEAA